MERPVSQLRINVTGRCRLSVKSMCGFLIHSPRKEEALSERSKSGPTKAMNLSNKTLLACSLLGVGFFSAPSNSNAALLAYDGFDYTAGNVNGQNGGTGWDTAWVATTSPVNASVVTGTTLAYSGGSISISGSGTALSIKGGGDGALNRSYVGTSTGGEIYFSMLFQSTSGSGDEFFNFFLSEDPDRHNSGGFGDLITTTGDARFGARINDGTTDTSVASSVSYTTGTTYLLVGRLSTDGTTGASPSIIDQAELWINPTSLTPGSANATVNASTGLALGDLVYFSSRMVNFASPDEILIDELRIGTDFASVVTVPEPSAACLLLLGGALQLALRRRSTRSLA